MKQIKKINLAKDDISIEVNRKKAKLEEFDDKLELLNRQKVEIINKGVDKGIEQIKKYRTLDPTQEKELRDKLKNRLTTAYKARIDNTEESIKTTINNALKKYIPTFYALLTYDLFKPLRAMKSWLKDFWSNPTSPVPEYADKAEDKSKTKKKKVA